MPFYLEKIGLLREENNCSFYTEKCYFSLKIALLLEKKKFLGEEKQIGLITLKSAFFKLKSALFSENCPLFFIVFLLSLFIFLLILFLVGGPEKGCLGPPTEKGGLKPPKPPPLLSRLQTSTCQKEFGE